MFSEISHLTIHPPAQLMYPLKKALDFGQVGRETESPCGAQHNTLSHLIMFAYLPVVTGDLCKTKQNAYAKFSVCSFSYESQG